MKQLFSLIIVLLALVSFPAGAKTLSPGGPYIIGEMITVQGDTNFNTDNKVLVEIYPASFGPTSKFDPSMAGGGTVVVPVVKNKSGLFSWSANISSAGWGPDQYMVRAEVIGKDYRETALIMLTGNQNPDTNQSGVSYREESDRSLSPPLQTRAPVSAQTVSDIDTHKQAPMQIETTIPAQTQTRQSPLAVGGIVCAILVTGICTGIRKRYITPR
jgi:hypothetical protein